MPLLLRQQGIWKLNQIPSGNILLLKKGFLICILQIMFLFSLMDDLGMIRFEFCFASIIDMLNSFYCWFEKCIIIINFNKLSKKTILTLIWFK